MNWNTSEIASVLILSSWAYVQMNAPVLPMPSLREGGRERGRERGGKKGGERRATELVIEGGRRDEGTEWREEGVIELVSEVLEKDEGSKTPPQACAYVSITLYMYVQCFF